MSFADKGSVLVTGANRGIGRSLVEALLKTKIRKVYAATRSLARLPDFSDDRVVGVKLDITNIEQVSDVVEQCQDINILINNAGVSSPASLIDGPLNLLERDMNTNYYGTLNMMRGFAPVLEQKEKAKIINIVTVGAFVNFPEIGGYCASKAALFSMSQGARIELKPRGGSVYTVNPGPVDTDMTVGFNVEKASPMSVAKNILTAVDKGELDIFPDSVSAKAFSLWKEDYRALERVVVDQYNSLK